MVTSTLLESYSEVLSYPAGHGLARVRRSLENIAGEEPSQEASLDGLRAYINSHEQWQLEEVFTSTFDSNAERALELGWHIHGENYARGVFMARMRTLLREHGIEESSELPDHISHVLLVIGRAKPELRSALIRGVVLQALEKIVAGFPAPANPYRELLEGLKQLLSQEESDE